MTYMEPSIGQGEKGLEMNYETYCKEILDLFRAAGKDVPHEDSDMGRAVQILQEICDSQSHIIPDADEASDDIKTELENWGWEFDNTPDGRHYAVLIDEIGTTRFDSVNLSDVIKQAAEVSNVDIDSTSEIFEALEEIEIHIGEDDFNLDFDGNEYRIISESDIWEIYVDAIKETVEDCYSDVINLDKIPSFIAVSIDWEQTAKNAYVDGYGHTFSSYDHSETEAAGYYIFRTN